MLNQIVLYSLIDKAIKYNMETEKSITIQNNDDLEIISSRIKSEDFTKLIIGDTMQSFPIFEGLHSINSLEIVSEQINSIPEEAFMKNQNIKNVKLSKSITTIANRPFYGSSISQINLENVNSIGESAFCDCINLQSADLQKIQSLDSSCFANTSLIEVNLSTDFMILPSYAFCNCFKLTTFISKCNSFGEYSFCNCTSLKIFKYDFKDTWEIHSTALISTAIEELEINSNAMRNDAFSKLPIKKLIIYSSSPYFNGGKYDGLIYYQNLKTIEFTRDTYSIALRNMNIEEIITPDDPDFSCQIDIAGCPKLKNLPNGIDYVRYAGDLPEIESVDLTHCKRIYRNSFFNCPKLWNTNLKFHGNADVHYPLSNTYIRELTVDSSSLPRFYNCFYLEKVVFLESSGMTTIDSSTFSNCIILTDVQLCSTITTISSYAFANTNISYLDFTNIMNLGVDAFY